MTILNFTFKKWDKNNLRISIKLQNVGAKINLIWQETVNLWVNSKILCWYYKKKGRNRGLKA